jgi:hypothetical protein
LPSRGWKRRTACPISVRIIFTGPLVSGPIFIR